MEKLKFEFVMKSGEDPKTNTICITSITDADQRTFGIPESLQPIRFHEEIIRTKSFQKVKTTLKRRHDKRQVWITLSPELKRAYVDEDGNFEINGYLLEETQQQAPATESLSALTSVLESFVEMRRDIPRSQNLKNLSERFVLEKFTKKTSNGIQWMTAFETECARLGIEEDISKIETLKLFLEDSCLDWYSSMLMKHTVISDWLIWKKSFCDTYVDKGWSPVRYAMLFKYRQGSLLDYALRKEKLLLEVNKTIDKPTLIDLIATGLPNFIADKIDRGSLKNVEDLFNNIRGLEHLVNKRAFDKKTNLENNIKDKNTRERPCRICEKENKGSRYHPESVCWFKNKENNQFKREQIRSVNNSELEIELNEIDSKN
ncbi:uncharacterized protein LOC135084836 [Ostrinia nubilalis]|uniref:uncharacterized protein LOC135084035 n=1 Tax=Ostrinia nubilalis TaxID=29057 RepID=UPI0030822BA8